MRIKLVEIASFRKLRSIRIDFNDETTLFVGANNSGKTSAMAALGHFLVAPENFTTNDFTLSNWKEINDLGRIWENFKPNSNDEQPSLLQWEGVLPSLDIWFEVASNQIHYVSHLLPTLQWDGGCLGLRLRFEPKDIERFYQEYVLAIRKAKETVAVAEEQLGVASDQVILWPKAMRDFLDRKLHSHFSLNAYILDPKKLSKVNDGVAFPQALPVGASPLQGAPLKGLMQIDVIYAQREFADATSSRSRSAADHGERRRLSLQLRKYYDKHLDPLESPEPSDIKALQALQNAEAIFNVRLADCFSTALKEVAQLGYPGVTDPKLTLATKVKLTDGLNHDSSVQYDILPRQTSTDTQPLRLPEHYNGLGYQNLISIVFSLMGFRDAWMRVGKASKSGSAENLDDYFRPPLHLVLIEEPEVHLHAQVQQVFIRKAYTLLRSHDELGENEELSTQLVVSTHSGHIAHESEFARLRYFRRKPASKPGEVPVATVVNLSEVFGDAEATARFVTRYIRATHCDLFFADAAVLIEGPAERILLPQFIRKDFPNLNSSYLTLLEIGGSHAHRLRRLIEELQLVTLIITDIDSMEPNGTGTPPARGRGLVTRNATLKGWVPEKVSLDDLFSLNGNEAVKNYDSFSIRVAYQKPVSVRLDPSLDPAEMLPNTFEDALVYENLDKFKGMTLKGQVQRFRENIQESDTPEALHQKMFVTLKTAKKAEFALDLLELTQEPLPLKVPAYIQDGLSWLEVQLQRKQDEVSSPPEIAPETAGTVG